MRKSDGMNSNFNIIKSNKPINPWPLNYPRISYTYSECFSWGWFWFLPLSVPIWLVSLKTILISVLLLILNVYFIYKALFGTITRVDGSDIVIVMQKILSILCFIEALKEPLKLLGKNFQHLSCYTSLSCKLLWKKLHFSTVINVLSLWPTHSSMSINFSLFSTVYFLLLYRYAKCMFGKQEYVKI